MEASGIIPAATIGTGSIAIPLLGLGTATFPFELNVDMVKSPILSAIRLGYRHFDTAASYHTEVPLGQAVEEALRDCLIGSREELFVTSKLWCSDAHPELVLPALRNTLKNLQMEYLDLYLIHWPVSYTPGKIEFPLNKDEIQPIDIRGVWKAMEDCQNLGLTKAIGVCNFSCKKLEDLISFAEIPPAVVQVEMNPLWRQDKLRQFCASKGINLTAYSPLGAKGTPWGSPQVMDNDVLKLIAKTREKTIAQVCLRWVFEQGVSVLVKSFNEKRMEENLKVLGWELNEEDLSKINDIPQARATTGHQFVSDSGPFKSIDDLWDGEV